MGKNNGGNTSKHTLKKTAVSSVPHAAVRFKMDGNERFEVPQYYIKDFKPANFYPGMNASVFWSPNSEDTPRKFKRSKGIILDLDKEADKKSKDSGPLAGYYAAEILQIAESLEQLQEAAELKRVSVPSAKAAEAIKAKASKNEAKEPKKQQDSYVSRERKKKNIKKSESVTVGSWKEKYGSNDSSPSSECSSDDQIITKKEVAHVEMELKRQNRVLTEKCEKLQTQLSEVTDLNIFWQKKYASSSGSRKPSSGHEKVRVNLFNNEESKPVHVSPKHQIMSLPVSLSNRSFLEVQGKNDETPKKKHKSNSVPVSPKNDSTNRSKSGSLRSHSFLEVQEKNNETPKIKHSLPITPMKNQQEFIESHYDDELLSNPDTGFNNSVEIKTPQLYPQKSPRKNYSPLKEQRKQKSPAKTSPALTPRKLRMAMSGVKKGKKGDSLFVKNLAMAIFGPELLIQSSYSGKPAVGGKKSKKKFACLEDSESADTGRPKLPEKQLDLLRSMFVERLKKEDPEMSDQAVNDRCACFRDAISHKIKYLRNSLDETVDETINENHPKENSDIAEAC